MYGGGGSYDAWKTGVAANGLINGFDFSFGYAYSKQNDYKTPRGKRVHHSSNDGLTTFTGSLGYTFAEKHRIGVSGFFYDVDSAYKPAFTDEGGVRESAKYSDKRNQFINITYDGGTADDLFTWSAGYSFGRNHTESYNAANDPANSPPFANYYDTRTAFADVTYNGDIFELTLGANYLRYDTDVGNNSTRDPDKSFNRQDSSTFYNKALFAVGKLKLLDESLILSAGARYDYYRITDDAPRRIQNTPDKTVYKNISPSAGIAYMPLEWLKLRANYSHGFRAPSGRELLEDNMYNYWGNPKLKAEHSDTYEIGTDLTFDHANVSVTYFFSKTFNYIYQHADTYYNSSTDTERHKRVQNTYRQYRSGIEAQGSVDIAGLLGWEDFEIRPMGSITYLTKHEELYRKHDPDGYTDLTWIPKYSAMGGISFMHKPSDLTVNANVTHIGQAMGNAGGDEKDLGHYTVTNMSVEKRIFAADDYGELKARLELNNMFNETYNSFNSDYAMPGRNFYLGVVYNY